MNGSNARVQHSMQGVFVFVLLGLFAVMSTLMVLLGAQMYRGTVERSELNNDFRVLNAYVRSMARAEDSAGAVAVEDLDGTRALALYEDIEGDSYVTWIYQYEGELYELFTEADSAFDPEDGTAICAANSFDAAVEGNLVRVSMTDADDEPCTVQVALRCAAE